jgi:predicted metalloprotease with PDZ domain
VDIGLKMEKRGKQYFVKEVSDGGLFQRMHGDRIEVGNRVVMVNGKMLEEAFTSLFDVNKFVKTQNAITIHVVREKT